PGTVAGRVTWRTHGVIGLRQGHADEVRIEKPVAEIGGQVRLDPGRSERSQLLQIAPDHLRSLLVHEAPAAVPTWSQVLAAASHPDRVMNAAASPLPATGRRNVMAPCATAR